MHFSSHSVAVWKFIQKKKSNCPYPPCGIKDCYGKAHDQNATDPGQVLGWRHSDRDTKKAPTILQVCFKEGSQVSYLVPISIPSNCILYPMYQWESSVLGIWDLNRNKPSWAKKSESARCNPCGFFASGWRLQLQLLSARWKLSTRRCPRTTPRVWWLATQKSSSANRAQ